MNPFLEERSNLPLTPNLLTIFRFPLAEDKVSCSEWFFDFKFKLQVTTKNLQTSHTPGLWNSIGLKTNLPDLGKNIKNEVRNIKLNILRVAEKKGLKLGHKNKKFCGTMTSENERRIKYSNLIRKSSAEKGLVCVASKISDLILCS